MRTKREIFDGEDEAIFLLKCSIDPRLWFRRVLGVDLQPYHEEWIHNVLSGFGTDRRFFCIQAHRGSGKTFIMGFGIITWLLWFGRPDKPGESVKCLVTSAAKEQAMKIMEEISSHLQDNELLNQLIPEHREKTWTKTEMTTPNNSKVYCKAFSDSARGLHVDYTLCDEAGQYKEHNVFRHVVSPTVNNRRGTIVLIGTPDSEIDLLQELSRNPQYWSKKYPVYTEKDGVRVSLWPSRFSLEEIEKIRKRDGESSFQKEYLLNPRAEADNSLFPANLIADCFEYEKQFVHGRTVRLDERGIEKEDGHMIFMGCDFAIAQGPRADFDSYIVVEKFGDFATILHGERHRGLPIAAKVARITDLYNRFRPRSILCDRSNVGQAIIEQLREKLLPVDGIDFQPMTRNAMLIGLRQVIEAKRLVIPRNEDDPLGMAFTNVLVKELVDFKETKTRTGLITYQSTSAHDDTVMSLCLAIKGVNSQKEFVDVMAF
jgi:hypothetical protein